jgi:hypothetical protein
MALPHHMRDCFCNLFLKVPEWQQKWLGSPAMRDEMPVGKQRISFGYRMTEGETAGPSTTLRSGRDDTSV